MLWKLCYLILFFQLPFQLPRALGFETQPQSSQVQSTKKFNFRIENNNINHDLDFELIEKKVGEIYHTALEFYKKNYPLLFSNIPENITLILDLKYKKSNMTAEYSTSSIRISWARMKKFFFVPPTEKNMKTIAYHQILLEQIMIHEMAHLIHYTSYLELSDNEKVLLINKSPENEDFREYLACLMESLYVIKKHGYSWYYHHFATMFLENDGLPPLLENEIANNADVGIYRRWAIFSHLLLQSECWKIEDKKVKMSWNLSTMESCLSSNEKKITDDFTPWVISSFAQTHFFMYQKDKDIKIANYDESIALSQLVLKNIIQQANVFIQSEIYRSPIYQKNDFIEYKYIFDIFTDKLSLLLDGWFLFRFHHLQGLFDKEKVIKYKIVDVEP